MDEKEKYKEKIKNFFKQPILYLIIVIILIQKIIYSNIPEVGRTGDTEGYLLSYSQASIFKGYLDQDRPPVYPYFIKLINKIVGEENLEKNIVIAQKVLFLASVILFYCTARLLINNKIIVSILTLIFGILPSINVWNTFIITESIVGFEMILLAFITIKYLKKPSKILAGGMGIILLGMILTKPVFIYLIPIYILFIVLRFVFNKEERKKLYFAMGSLIICGVVLILYCIQMNNLYGTFGLTAISNKNTLLTAIYSGAYIEIPDNKISQKLSEIIGKQPTEEETYVILNDNILNNYSDEEIEEFAELSMKTNAYKMFVVDRFAKIVNTNIGVSYSFGNQSEEGEIYNLNVIGSLMFPITFGMIYIILLISIIYLIWYLIKYKKINWICAFFTSAIFANIFTLIFGAPFEEQRLFFPSMCLVLLYIGVIIEKFKLKEENLLNERNIK